MALAPNIEDKYEEISKYIQLYNENIISAEKLYELTGIDASPAVPLPPTLKDRLSFIRSGLKKMKKEF